jgi:hypothetical protein
MEMGIGSHASRYGLLSAVYFARGMAARVLKSFSPAYVCTQPIFLGLSLKGRFLRYLRLKKKKKNSKIHSHHL